MSTVGRRALAALFIAVNWLWAFRPQPDSDWFLHVTYGREILARRAVDFPDPYLWTETGLVWFDHHWGAQVLLALLDARGGFMLSMAAVALAAAGVAAVALAPVFTRLRPALALVFALLFTWTLGVGITPRPHVLSYVALALVLLLHRRGGPWWAYAPVYLVWANVHGSVTMGLAVLGLLCLERAWDARESGARAALREMRALAGAVAAAVLNPHGPSLLLYAGGFLDERFQLIQEWQPVDFRDPTYWGLLALILFGGHLLLRSPRRVPFTDLVLVGGLLAATLLAVRHTPYLAIALAYVVVRHRDERPALEVGRAGRLLELAAPAAIVLLAAAITVDLYPRRLEEGWAKYPSAAALAAVPADARVFNRYDFGGAMLYNGRRPFIDGRTDMYSPALFNDYRAVVAARAGFLAPLERWDVTHVIMGPRDRLPEELARVGACFEPIFRDQTAVVLRKVGPCRPDPAVRTP